MSRKAILLVSSNPVSEDRTDDFNAWYAEVHVPQVIEHVPGIVRCTRYRLDEASPVRPGHRYLAAYEIEADEPADVLGALSAAMEAGKLDMSDALDTGAPPQLVLYQRI